MLCRRLRESAGADSDHIIKFRPSLRRFAGCRVHDGLAECVVATAERVDRDAIDLALADGRAKGCRAFSCLVVPRAGDTVSVVRNSDGRHYVIAILERADAGDVELFSDRPLTIHSAAEVRVAAATALELAAGEQIRVRSAVVEAVVGRFVAFAKFVSVTSGEALLQTRLARLCSDLIDVAARHLGVYAQHSHRQIEGTDQVRCRHFDLQASEVAHVRGQIALVKAEALVKMDAAQIQIG